VFRSVAEPAEHLQVLELVVRRVQIDVMDGKAFAGRQVGGSTPAFGAPEPCSLQRLLADLPPRR
jgi:hypothetical protein